MNPKSHSRRRPTPKGLRPPAQGCEVGPSGSDRATLGKRARKPTNPERVVPPCTHPAEYECPDCKQTTERTCINCGCTDSRACSGGCEWIQTHTFGNTGVCSNCYSAALSALVKAINESEEPVFAASQIHSAGILSEIHQSKNPNSNISP
jgi:hypothetical protein